MSLATSVSCAAKVLVLFQRWPIGQHLEALAIEN